MKLFLILTASIIISISSIQGQGSTDFEISKNLDIYAAVYKQLFLHYAEDFQVGDLNKKAIDAMLMSLDPYTNYYAESDIEDVRYMQTGKYGGVGASIHSQSDTITVGSVLKDFPFYNAGVRAGDKLIEADGQTLVGKTADEMSEILKGNAGSSLKLKIIINKTGESRIIDIKRSEIKILNVPYFGMLENGVAYIKLSQFTENAAAEVESALKKLSTENKLNGLVLDLRDNGGGLLQQAVEIMDIFLPPGLLIVETKGKVKAENQRYSTRKPASFPDISVVVLINSRSASASEIVAGAFQDYDRGVILGQKSYGKGLVQKVFPLSYNSQMKITVAKYYIPSGRCIQEINYGNHDKEGKATKIADSLRGEYKTKGGRTVKDAGGILPDKPIDHDNHAPIVFDIARNQHIFNYSSIYVYKNDSIKNLDQFKLTEADFDDFLKYLAKKNYAYKSPAIEILNKLESDNLALNNEELKQELAKLKVIYEKSNSQQIIDNKEDILNLLEQEIISRYYFDYGRIKKGLNVDNYIKEATNLINNKTEYQRILQP